MKGLKLYIPVVMLIGFLIIMPGTGETKNGLPGGPAGMGKIPLPGDSPPSLWEGLEFNKVVIGNTDVYWKQRVVNGAIVEGDFITYQVKNRTHKLIKSTVNWQRVVPYEKVPQVSRETAESLVRGEVQFSNLYYISPESHVYPIRPVPENPCWVVRSVDNGAPVVTLIDAVTAEILGYGIAPPSTAFSMDGGYNYSYCTNEMFDNLAYDARDQFRLMGYSLNKTMVRPLKAVIQSSIQNPDIAMFYEIGHSHETSTQFQCGCSDNGIENTTASEITSWIAAYPKMPFTFIASCNGSCNTGPGTLSDAFRKGSSKDTVTIGFCEMSAEKCNICWDQMNNFQKALFSHMNNSETVKDAFDNALKEYPNCSQCVRFTGDPSFKVVPLVRRGGPADTRIIIVSCIPEPSGTNKNVTITAIVIQNTGQLTPTGSVRFYDGTTPLLSPVPVGSDGISRLNVTFGSRGSRSITARYFSNNTNFFNSSTSQPITHVVLIPSTTTIKGTPNPSVHSQQVAIQAIVTGGIRVRSGPVSWAPTGEVEWVIDGVSQPTTSTVKNGQAIGLVSWLSVGNHTITANYPGDSKNAASSASYVQMVNKVGSAVGWGASRNTTVFGQPVTFTAVVTAEPPGTGIPTGNVTFFDRYTIIADKVPLDASGKATYTTSQLTTGIHSIRVTYNGDTNFTRSTIQWSQLVKKADTTLSLESSGSPSLRDDPVTFYATVMIVPPGSGTIGGTVRFLDGDISLGTRSVSPAGEVSFTTPKLSVGDHSITAHFSGNTDLNPSGSSVVIHTVKSGLT